MNDNKEEKQAFIKWAVRNQYDVSEISTVHGVLFKRQSTTDAWLGWLYSAKAKAEKLEGCVVVPVWVAVDFMLPDLGSKVLIYIADEVISAEYTILGFVDSIEGAMLHQNLITHWMHLPNVPEAARGGNE